MARILAFPMLAKAVQSAYFLSNTALRSIFSRGKKTRAVFLFALILIGVSIAIEPAYAGGILSDIGQGIVNAISAVMLAVARLFISLTVVGLKLFIEFAKYNGYIDTPTVVVGWTMVRDVANLFFVVGLLVIAFGTILGVEKYEWQKMIMKLLIAAVFINFSKLIAGLIIDIAHVFTMTFINAISASAGGNLVKMFKLEAILSLTGASDPAAADDINIAVFGASVVAIFFAAVVMVTMFAYTIVLLARMVALWVLIILAPLAYILHAIPSDKAQGYAKEYWSEFLNYVMVAPLMVFFLWLAFATLGSGDVATQLQLDVGSSAAEAQSLYGVGGKQVALSEVASWENIANLLIAVTFLWIGLEKVKATGVAGAGLVSGAIDFGKKVATIASGYALGRAIYEKGRDEVVDTGKDYGKLLYGASIGKLRHVKGIRDIPLLGAAGKARRKAAVERLEELEGLHEEEYKKGGPKGLARWLAPSKKRVAEQAVRTALVGEVSDSERKDLEQTYVVTLEAEEREDYIKRKARLLGKEFGKELENLGLKEEMSVVLSGTDAAGNGVSMDARQDKLKEIEKSLQAGEYKDAAGQTQKQRALDSDTRRKIDKDAVSGLRLYKSILAKMYETESKGDAEAIKMGLDGKFNLGYFTDERNELERRMAKAEETLLDQEASVILGDGTKMTEARNSFLAKTKDTLVAKYQKYLESIKDSDPRFQGKSEEEKDADIRTAVESFKSGHEELLFDFDQDGHIIDALKGTGQKDIQVHAEDLVAANSPTEIAKAYASTQISDQDRALAYREYEFEYGGEKRKGVTDGLVKLGGEYLTKNKERERKKFETETERLGARMGDFVRAEQGKLPELERNYEYKKGMEELKEYEGYTYAELVEHIRQNHQIIQRLNAKPEDQWTEEEREGYKNYHQRQARVVASFMSRYSGTTPWLMGDLDHSYQGKPLLDPNETHTMVLGLLSGKDYDTVSADPSKVQEGVRSAMKEKAAPLFRALLLGAQAAADKGFAGFYDQFRVGVDQFGQKKIGLSNTFREGVGAAQQLGTGVIGKTGRDVRDEEMRNTALPGVNIQTSKDGRAYVVVDGTGKSIDVLTNEHRRAIRSLSSLTQHAIEQMGPNKVWEMMGGSWGSTPWDGKMFQVTDRMAGVVRETMRDFAQNYTQSKGAAKENTLKAWKAALRSLKIDRIDGKLLGEATANEVAQFLNRTAVLKNPNNVDIKVT